MTAELIAATKKWQDYEREHILPLFERAKELGFDLQELVFANPGKNSTELFVAAVVGMLVAKDQRIMVLEKFLEELSTQPYLDRYAARFAALQNKSGGGSL